MSNVKDSSWRPIPKMVRCLCGALVFERNKAKHLEEEHGFGMLTMQRIDPGCMFVEPENPKPEDGAKAKKRIAAEKKLRAMADTMGELPTSFLAVSKMPTRKPR